MNDANASGAMSEDGEASERQVLDLTQSADAQDRMWAAQNLSKSTTEGLSALRRLLDDVDPDVRGVAAQSLALAGDAEVMRRLLSLLNEDDGQAVRPIAWAVSTLAKAMDPSTQRSAEDALEALRQRGISAVQHQVDLLLASDE